MAADVRVHSDRVDAGRRLLRGFARQRVQRESRGPGDGCSADYSQTPAYSNIGGDCYSPNAHSTERETVNGGIINPKHQPAMATFTKYYRLPTSRRSENGYASSATTGQECDGYEQRFQLHGRVDENISDT